MVDADRGLTIDGKEITPKGKLLTLTNEEAAREYGHPPTPLLSAGTVKVTGRVVARKKSGLSGSPARLTCRRPGLSNWRGGSRRSLHC